MRPLSVWRLELLRLVRTRRLVALLAVFVLSGLAGPPTARYLEEIIRRFGGGMRVETPPATPVDGMIQYLQWFGQLGVLAIAMVAAGALVLDARPEFGVFLRTRAGSVRRLLLPRFAVTVGAVLLAYAVGTVAAVYETTVLLGALPAGRTLLGAAMTGLYLVFVVATVALAAGLVRSTVATVGLSVGTLIVLPIAGLLPDVRPWLPSTLLNAVADVPAGVDPHWRAALSAAALIPLLLAAAIRLLERREI